MDTFVYTFKIYIQFSIFETFYPLLCKIADKKTTLLQAKSRFVEHTLLNKSEGNSTLVYRV